MQPLATELNRKDYINQTLEIQLYKDDINQQRKRGLINKIKYKDKINKMWSHLIATQ